MYSSPQSEQRLKYAGTFQFLAGAPTQFLCDLYTTAESLSLFLFLSLADFLPLSLSALKINLTMFLHNDPTHVFDQQCLQCI